jgi:hypothetical protein
MTDKEKKELQEQLVREANQLIKDKAELMQLKEIQYAIKLPKK